MGFPVTEVIHFAIAAIVNNCFAGIITRFTAHLREKCRETVVVVHRPAIEGMVMALRALDAHAHENLRGIFGEFQGIRLDLIIVGGGIAEVAFGGGENMLDDLVEGDVCEHLIAKPFEVEDSCFWIDAVIASADFEKLGPFHDPQFGEFLSCEQLVYKLFAFGRVGILEKFSNLLRLGQCAIEIEEARRMNVASSQISEGMKRSFLSFA